MRFSAWTLSRHVFCLIALLWAVSALAAPISHETVERLAGINVEKAELHHLNSIGKLSDADYNSHTAALEKEAAALWQPHRLMANSTPAEAAEIQTATSAIAGLSRAKLSLLEPVWKKEEGEYRRAGEKQREDTVHDIEKNAQQAAHIQKQRQGLQQQLDKGTIDRTAFNTKDKEALAAIETLRNKHQGTREGLRFDERLTYYAAQPEKPPAPHTVAKPAPQVVVTVQPKVVETDYTLWYWIGGGIIVLLILGWAASDKEEQAPTKPTTSGIHGTADWHAIQTGKPPVAVSTGVHFGQSSSPEYKNATPPNTAPIVSRPEAHTLIVARTRAGKGTRVIIPTLLRYQPSMLIIDPKGENAAITARTRRDQLGHTVHIVNPWGELTDHYDRLGFTTATFNPLDAIDRNDPNAVAIAQRLAATISPISGDKDKFWQGSAANILAAVMLWVSERPGEQKTLARTRELVTQSREDFKRNLLAPMMASEAFGGAIKEMVSQYYDLAPETYSGIISNLSEATKFLSDPQIKATTAASSFSMQELRDKYMTVYLVIPHDRIHTHSTWLRLVISSAMQALKDRTKIAKPPHHRCMFMIDEFGSIGHMPDMAGDIALMSGYGLDFTLIVQGIDQIKHHYGEAGKTILSNCGYKWYCYLNELETAKYLSESLGKKTVQTISKSQSQGSNKGGETEGSSTSYGETGRSLLNPDEILHLGREVAILQHPYGLPHYLRPVDYWKLQQTYPGLYSNPPLSYEKNPYVPTSTALSASSTTAPNIPASAVTIDPAILKMFPSLDIQKPKRK